MNLTLQPRCLKWARERGGLSIPALARKLGVKDEKVSAWEKSGELSWALLDKLANVTHTPLGYLFLPEPPTETLPIGDFRTVETGNIAQPSPDLLDTVHEVLRRQDWYREYILNNGGEPLPFVRSLQVSPDIIGAAKRVRDVVAWNAELRTESPSRENHLSRHIESVEDAGILVMRSGIVGNNTHRSLDVTEFRGFALSDAYAPLVFINAKDAKAAQLFTLAHELVHIWLGVSGVSNLNLTYSPDVDVERFCNAVAAELLVPFEELQTVWSDMQNATHRISATARHFRVSSLVILRRLLDAGYISRDDFQRLYTDELAQFHQRDGTTEGGGDYYRTLHTRLGKRFMSALIESTLEGGTPYREALHLLGVKNPETVRKLASRLAAAA